MLGYTSPAYEGIISALQRGNELQKGGRSRYDVKQFRHTMKVGRLSLALSVLLITSVGMIMIFGNSDRRNLLRLLGSEGEVIIEHATIHSWAPDPNSKPLAFYVISEMDDKAFESMVRSLQLVALPSGPTTEAVWNIPDDKYTEGWMAKSIPQGYGKQVNGTVGGGAVWLRWYRGTMNAVILPSSP